MVEYKKYDDLKEQQYFSDSVSKTTSTTNTVKNGLKENQGNSLIARFDIFF